MFIIKHKKIFMSVSVALVALAVISLLVFGLEIGIDFKGGALTEVVYTEIQPETKEVEVLLAPLGLGTVLVQPTGEKGYIIKTKDLTEAEHAQVLESLSNNGENPVTLVNFNSIGPSVGKELTRKAIIAIVLVSLAIIFFIAFAFRHVSRPVSSWKYGLIAIVTLLHDVIIPVGIFTVLSHYFGAEVDALFVVSVLTILGLSVSDTIVIFDRIRENLKDQEKLPNINFSETVGRSLEQSFVRSLCTSITVLLVLIALVVWGPASTRYFSLMLAAGMFFGAYSSLFLASPLLVTIEEWQNRKR